MKYKINMEICNPNNPKSHLWNHFIATFSFDPKNYGNGYYVHIASERAESPMIYDLRYDTSFNPCYKEQWLRNWANKTWNGKGTAYKVKFLEIKEIEDV